MTQRKELQYIDLSYLIDYSEGNKEFIEGMMEQCIETIPDVIANLKLDLDQQDWAKLRVESHKFVPVIPFAGFVEILNDMQKIELLSSQLSQASDPGKEKELRSLVLSTIVYCQFALPELIQEYERIKNNQ